MKYIEAVQIFISKLFHTGMVQKLIIGYVFIIFIPVNIVGYLVYNQFYEDVLQEFSKERQQLMEQSHTHLQLKLAQTESVYELLQINSLILDYLQGFYGQDAERVYLFLRYVRPVFSYIQSGNPLIEQLSIYKYNEVVMPVYPEILAREELQMEEQFLASIPPGQGRWLVQYTDRHQVPELLFIQNIYNTTYTAQLGVMQVALKEDLIRDFLDSLDSTTNENLFIMLDRQNQIIYQNNRTKLTSLEIDRMVDNYKNNKSNSFYLDDQSYIVNSVYIDDLELRLVKVGQANDIFANMKERRNLLITIIFLLLITLSFFYYLLASSISKGVLSLARHMRSVNIDNLKLFQFKSNVSEIEILTSSYNSLMKRIDDLVNNVQREKLSRKEAEYLALQSQINPHFIYNTLEMIRMMAEMNEDQEVAEISYTFGRLMRYSLSPKVNAVSLEEELNHVRDYIKIQQMRMGDRLEVHFDIQLEADKWMCPRFILQPIVENSFVHGITKSRRKGRITIEAFQEAEQTLIRVRDNGVGMEEQRLALIKQVLLREVAVEEFQTTQGGLGLYNINERIKLFYGEASQLSMESNREGGSVCTILMRRGG